jgi:hypothetical protein
VVLTALVDGRPAPSNEIHARTGVNITPLVEVIDPQGRNSSVTLNMSTVQVRTPAQGDGPAFIGELKAGAPLLFRVPGTYSVTAWAEFDEPPSFALSSSPLEIRITDARVVRPAVVFERLEVLKGMGESVVEIQAVLLISTSEIDPAKLRADQFSLHPDCRLTVDELQDVVDQPGHPLRLARPPMLVRGAYDPHRNAWNSGAAEARLETLEALRYWRIHMVGRYHDSPWPCVPTRWTLVGHGTLAAHESVDVELTFDASSPEEQPIKRLRAILQPSNGDSP